MPPSEGVSSDINFAAFHAYVAIALHESGKDASAEEQAMRRFTSKPDFKIVGWSWDEVDTWLKKTKLVPRLQGGRRQDHRGASESKDAMRPVCSYVRLSSLTSGRKASGSWPSGWEARCLGMSGWKARRTGMSGWKA